MYKSEHKIVVITLFTGGIFLGGVFLKILLP